MKFKVGDLVQDCNYDIYYVSNTYTATSDQIMDLNVQTYFGETLYIMIINNIKYLNPGHFNLVTDILRE